jgi:hypothetical protein
METELCKIFHHYKADKCPGVYHSYSPVYHKHLQAYRNTFKNILEVGVGNVNCMNHICGEGYQAGASLRGWRDYFTNANIYGLDIQRDVLFEEKRIKCFYADQSNKESLEESIQNIRTFKGNEQLMFDMIIDDGSHDVNHMLLTFLVLAKYVTPGGIYIIEDIKKHEIDIFKNINVNGFKIIEVHEGTWNWDAFIIYQNI